MNELLLQSGIPVSKNNSSINEMNYYDANSISENVLFEILLNGKILPSPDINILNILYGELDSFFEGNITAKEYSTNVQKQVELYLKEIF